MNNRIIFDTETIGLEKAFCYNLGYVITDENGKTLIARNFIIRQIYDNKPLFATAYYAKKRPIYTAYLKGKKAVKVSWGKACQIMMKDIKDFEVENAYAYNSKFDEKVFYFNHLFFRNKTRPLDIVKVHDIMDYISVFTETDDYKEFCKTHGLVNKNGKVKRTAENTYAYITNNHNYKEEHTALEDSKIESAILTYCLNLLR